MKDFIKEREEKDVMSSEPLFCDIAGNMVSTTVMLAIVMSTFVAVSWAEAATEPKIAEEAATEAKIAADAATETKIAAEAATEAMKIWAEVAEEPAPLLQQSSPQSVPQNFPLEPPPLKHGGILARVFTAPQRKRIRATGHALV